MEFLKRIWSVLHGTVDSKWFGYAETGAFVGQFAVDGLGKYESLANAAKYAVKGDMVGVASGMGGFLTKSWMQKQGHGSFFSSAVGEVVEWLINKTGILGMGLLIGAVLLVPSLREHVMETVGLGGKKSEEVSAATVPGGQSRDPAQIANVNLDKNLQAAIAKDPDLITRIGSRISAQGDVVDMNGKPMSQAALNTLITNQQEAQRQR